MLNGKDIMILLIVGLMSGYFPKPKSLGTKVKVELSLSKYAKKQI